MIFFSKYVQFTLIVQEQQNSQTFHDLPMSKNIQDNTQNSKTFNDFPGWWKPRLKL